MNELLTMAGSKTKPTFDDLHTLWVTHHVTFLALGTAAVYARNTKAFLSEFGTRAVQSITVKELNAHFERQEQQVGKKLAHERLRAVSSMLGSAVDW